MQARIGYVRNKYEVHMLKRRAYEKLLSWKAEAPEKALLVDGARQVGKTFLIE